METKEENLIALTKRELLALLGWSSKDETRQNLNGLGFLPGGKVRIAATDGHRLLVRTVEYSYAGPVRILSRSRLEAVAKAATHKDTIHIELADNGANVWVLGGLRTTIEYVDAEFPPVEQVIPKRDVHPYTGCVPVIADARYLADLYAVTNAIGSRTHGVTIVSGTAGLDPFLVSFANGDAWLAVIMPQRGDVDRVPEFEETVARRLCTDARFAGLVAQLAGLEPAELAKTTVRLENAA